MTVLQPEGLTLSAEERRESLPQSSLFIDQNEQFKHFQISRELCRIQRKKRKLRVVFEDLEVGDYIFSLPKHRNYWFWYSHDSLRCTRDLGCLESLDPVEYGFNRWRQSYVHKTVHLVKDDSHIFIRQYSRFDVDYRSNLRSKFRMLDLMLWDLKIELEIDPKKFFTLWDEFHWISRAWNKLRSWLKRRYGDFEFLRVLEPQKSGRPHLHVLLSGIHWIPWDELHSVWQKYGGGGCYIKSVYGRSNLKATAYVLKYVNKTLRNSEKRYSSLLFASNKRVFGISGGCQNMVNVGRVKKEPKGYVFLGSVSSVEVEGFLREHGLEFGFMVVVEVETHDYYEYPSIFGG